MSAMKHQDAPCACGCGQDAATIERLRERLAKVEALLDEWDAWDGSPDGPSTSPYVRDALRAALAGESDD